MFGSCSDGLRDSQHSIRTRGRQVTTGRSPLMPAVVHANCEFSLRGSDSFGSSEPKETKE